MQDDNDNSGLTDETQSEKQKRSRKRKSESDTVSTQAYQVAAHLHTSNEDASVYTAQAATSPPNTVTAEEYPLTLSTDAPQAPHTSAHAQADWPPLSGCGGQLKAAREAQGLSIHEVCSQLRLGVHQIQAIENDDFAKLPQKSIVRGFIRNYARLLKVDAQPILLAYQQLIPEEAPANISVKSSAYTAVINAPVSPVNLKSLFAVLLGLIAVGLLAYFYVHHVQPVAMVETPAPLTAEQETPPLSEPSPATISPTEAPVTEPNALNVSGDTIAPSNEALATGAVTAETTQNTQQTASNTTNTSNTTNSTANNLASANAPALPMNGYTSTATTSTPATNTVAIATTLKALDPVKAQLTFTVSEASWVKIEDVQGKKVFSEVLTPGDAKTITVDKPFSIIVGHANATQLMIDNQSYDLTQATRGRVARVQLK